MQSELLSDKLLSAHDVVYVSHHDKSMRFSPCTSVYELFIGSRRIFDIADFIHTGDSDSSKAISSLQNHQKPLLLFNGATSLCSNISLALLMHAVACRIPVVVYWHETAWNLRWFLERNRSSFEQAISLLQAADSHHLVPTDQNRQFIMFLIGAPTEKIKVVFETIDIEQYEVREKFPFMSGDIVKIVGAGVPDLRKGIDIFSILSKSLTAEKTGFESSFSWFSPRETKTNSLDVHPNSNIIWMGNTKAFPEVIKDFDIFAMTSRDDPSPIVCLEALASGIPVFCFNTTGYTEILPKEFVAKNTEDMIDKISKYITESDKYEPGLFRKIAEDHDISKFSKKIKPEAIEATPINMPVYTSFSEYDGLSRMAQTLATEIVRTKFERERLVDARIKSVAKLSEAKVEQANVKLVDAKRQLAEVKLNLDATDNELKEAKSILSNYSRQVDVESIGFWRRDFRERVMQTSEVKKVVIVGNSPALRGAKAGADIDSGDVVIRINNYQIEGFEEDVGEKTSFAIVSPACHSSSDLDKLDDSQILLYAANKGHDSDYLKERMLREGAIGRSLQNITVLPTTLYFYRLRRFLKYSGSVWPSTGYVAMRLALDIFTNASIFIHGFSFYKESGDDLQHYFGMNTTRDKHHNFDAEFLDVEALILKGDLHWLQQPLEATSVYPLIS